MKIVAGEGKKREILGGPGVGRSWGGAVLGRVALGRGWVEKLKKTRRGRRKRRTNKKREEAKKLKKKKKRIKAKREQKERKEGKQGNDKINRNEIEAIKNQILSTQLGYNYKYNYNCTNSKLAWPEEAWPC